MIDRLTGTGLPGERTPQPIQERADRIDAIHDDVTDRPDDLGGTGKQLSCQISQPAEGITNAVPDIAHPGADVIEVAVLHSGDDFDHVLEGTADDGHLTGLLLQVIGPVLELLDRAAGGAGEEESPHRQEDRLEDGLAQPPPHVIEGVLADLIPLRGGQFPALRGGNIAHPIRRRFCHMTTNQVVGGTAVTRTLNAVVVLDVVKVSEPETLSARR